MVADRQSVASPSAASGRGREGHSSTKGDVVRVVIAVLVVVLVVVLVAAAPAEGSIVQDGKSQPIPHPALDIERRAQAEILKWSGKFTRR